MLTKEEIETNINYEWNIPTEFQKESRYGLNRFIIDTTQKMKLQKEIPCLSMHLCNYFFVKNSYFNYDKLTMGCAAILLSSKTRTSNTQIFDNLCSEYSIISTKLQKDSNKLVNQYQLQQQLDIHKIKEEIGKYELLLLKQFDYKLPEEYPYDYIHVYSYLLYPNNGEEMVNLAYKVACDSYFTYVNNLFPSYVVALSCLIIAAKFLSIPTLLDDNFKFLDRLNKINFKGISEEKFNELLFQFSEDGFLDSNNDNFIGDNEEKNNEEYFKKLNLAQKLYPGLQMEKLLECVSTITEYYEDMEKKSKEDSKGQK